MLLKNEDNLKNVHQSDTSFEKMSRLKPLGFIFCFQMQCIFINVLFGSDLFKYFKTTIYTFKHREHNRPK